MGDRDLAALTGLWHEDLVEDFVVLGPVSGKPAARALFAELFDAVSDLRFEVESVSEEGATAVLQWRLLGRFDGGPFQGIQASGRDIDLRGVDVMVFEDGLLRHNTVYYDGLRFARQVGVLPPEGSRRDRSLMAMFNGMTRMKRRIRRS